MRSVTKFSFFRVYNIRDLETNKSAILLLFWPVRTKIQRIFGRTFYFQVPKLPLLLASRQFHLFRRRLRIDGQIGQGYAAVVPIVAVDGPLGVSFPCLGGTDIDLQRPDGRKVLGVSRSGLARFHDNAGNIVGFDPAVYLVERHRVGARGKVFLGHVALIPLGFAVDLSPGPGVVGSLRLDGYADGSGLLGKIGCLRRGLSV